MLAYLAQWEAQWLILRDVAIAMVLGGLIGAEREFASKPAGFRTHTLVAGAAALLMGISDILVESFGIELYSGTVRADPIRIVEAIITGISFLGAGTIFRSDNGKGVEGLTTAASILVSSAVGITAALNQWVLAVGVTLFSLLMLRIVKLIVK
jgi:putative Mg2+ transporter-C (MgtC) family protein